MTPEEEKLARAYASVEWDVSTPTALLRKVLGALDEERAISGAMRERLDKHSDLIEAAELRERGIL